MRTTRFLTTLAALSATALTALAGAGGPARAEIPGNHITIGVLTDMNGGQRRRRRQGIRGGGAAWPRRTPPRSCPASRSPWSCADHQNNPDVASTIARGWIANDGVNVIADVPYLVGRAGGERGDARRPAHRVHGLGLRHQRPDGQGVLAQHGAMDLRHLRDSATWWRARWWRRATSRWFFIAADYAFGAALERDTAQDAAVDRRHRGGRREEPALQRRTTRPTC